MIADYLQTILQRNAQYPSQNNRLRHEQQQRSGLSRPGRLQAASPILRQFSHGTLALPAATELRMRFVLSGTNRMALQQQSNSCELTRHG